MNWLDLFIVLFLLAALMRGVEIGFVRQFFSTLGFIGGLFLGALVVSAVGSHVHSPNGKALLALLVVLGAALLLMTAGEYIGLRIKFKLRETRTAEKIDNIFGSVLAGATLLAGIWLSTAIFRNVPDGAWQRQIRGSRVVATLSADLPSAPNLLTDLGHLIDPNGFPQVFAGLEPSLPTDTPLPNMGELTAAVSANRASIVKIEGQGCGAIIAGSGFVAAENQVVTNAHVVAGVKQPYVLDQNGQHKASVIWFDPDLDMAVLKVNGLKGGALKLTETIASNGTPAAIAGYPGGGGFKAGPGVTLDSFRAVGRNIYNQGTTNREVYSIKGEVEQGNSGGPLITKDGSVIGVIFAKSTSYSEVGYALTANQIISELHQANQQNRLVGTGSCTES
ncbi:MAG TPA: MarP family serine protease [Bacillota bacterium]|nr:MarP family serine protease [Bacillota bacterium]